jgi:hypothetical protein
VNEKVKFYEDLKKYNYIIPEIIDSCNTANLWSGGEIVATVNLEIKP